MASQQIRIVHYLNQFFGGIGGEDKADVSLRIKEGPIGPGIGLQGAPGGPPRGGGFADNSLSKSSASNLLTADS